jgi:hypothetical protein
MIVEANCIELRIKMIRIRIKGVEIKVVMLFVVLGMNQLVFVCPNVNCMHLPNPPTVALLAGP